MHLQHAELFMNKYIDQDDNISFVVGIKGLNPENEQIGVIIKITEESFNRIIAKVEDSIPTFHPTERNQL